MPSNDNSTIRFLLAQLRPHRTLVTIAILGAALAGVMDSLSIGLLVPLLASIQETGNGDMPAALELFASLFRSVGVEPSIGPIIAAVLAAITAKNLLQLATFGIAFHLSARIQAEVRDRAASLLMHVGMAYFDRERASDLADVWYNKAKALEELIRAGVTFVAHLLTGLALFVLLFVLSWQLTLITLLLAGLGLVLLRAHSRRTNVSGRRFARLEQQLLGEMHESLAGIRLIRSTATAPRVLERLSQRIDANARQQALGNFLVYAMHPGADLLGSLGIAALALLALGTLDMSPTVALTVLLPFLYVLLRLVPLGRALAHQRARLAYLWPNVDAVVDLLRTDDKPFLVDGDREFTGLQQAIHFDDVSFTYPHSNEPALSWASFAIPAGRTTAIIGESGCGKTTVIQLLLRLYDTDSGKILFDDTPIERFRIDSLHARVGIVAQETILFNDTIRANLAFTAQHTPDDAELTDAAQKAGIHEVIQRLPDGYDTLIGDRGVRLSGGQRQRLALARAFLRNPDILILDEATSALDNRTERHVQQSIKSLSADKTVIVVAHRLSTIEDADHVIVLKDGRVAESGDLEQLRHSGGEYSHLARSNL